MFSRTKIIFSTARWLLFQTGKNGDLKNTLLISFETEKKYTALPP